MNDQEYARWVWTGALKSTLQALGIYGSLLGAYWVFVG
jgi:hypothetical protein